MRVTCIGTVIGDGSYTDKKEGREVACLQIAIDGEAFRVEVESVAAFRLYEQVLVAGDLRQFDRKFYFGAVGVRSATALDLEVCELARVVGGVGSGLGGPKLGGLSVDGDEMEGGR